MKRTELFVLVLIVVVAAGFRLYRLDTVPPGLDLAEASNGITATQAWEAGDRTGLFINLQALAIYHLGTTVFALRLVAALAGIFTVLGTYLLARRLFDNWELSAIAAFLMAVGSWHVTFSRVGLVTVLAPLCAVWGLYYLYKGLETTRVWPWLLAGFWLGLGFHTTMDFRVMPAVVAVVILAYLYAIRTDFRHDKYAHIRQQLWGSMAAMLGIMIIVLIPTTGNWYSSPTELIETGASSVFTSGHFLRDITTNLARTVGMFFFNGDQDWRHGVAGQPALFWPLGVLFVVGLMRSGYKILRTWRTHGHPSIVHVLVLSWLCIGLVPAALINSGVPNAALAMLIAPAVYIITGQGVWWLYVWMRHWYSQRDVHRICLPGPHGHQWCTGEGQLVVGFALVVFLLAMGIADASNYFIRWGEHQQTAQAYHAHYIRIAERLNTLPPGTLKYVIVSRGEASAQPVMYLTDTSTAEKQEAKNLFYLTKEQFRDRQYRRGAVVIQLDP